MRLPSVPFRLDERLERFGLGVPSDQEVTAAMPPGDPWTRIAALHEQVATAVGAGPVVVASGDCTTTSGYLGGMPLALAVGRGDLALPRALQLPPVPEDRVVLVDARDTDPGEHRLLEDSAVTRTSVADLPRVVPTEGDRYAHVDVDVCTPAQVPDLLHPAEGGSDVADVLAAAG